MLGPYSRGWFAGRPLHLTGVEEKGSREDRCGRTIEGDGGVQLRRKWGGRQGQGRGEQEVESQLTS